MIATLPAGEISISIRWRLRPSTSIFAPFGESAKHIRQVAGLASGTLTVGWNRFQKRDARKLEIRKADISSEFSVLRLEALLVQCVQVNFLSVLLDGGNNVQCHGESAAAVFERYQRLGALSH